MSSDPQPQPRPLPEKVLRRHTEMLADLLPEITRLVQEDGVPADRILHRHLRSHRELGGRDRRFLSQAIFSYFRWFGWVVKRLQLPILDAALLSAALDADELSQSFLYLEKQCRLPQPIIPLGSRSLEEKTEILNSWFQKTLSSPLLLSDLVPPDFQKMLSSEKIGSSIFHFQHRPPTWLRLRSPSKKIEATLQSADVPFSVHPNLPTALSVLGGTGLTNLLAPFSARFVIQDLSSQCVALAANPQPGSDWWDVCAGAGGKSLHLADLMGEEAKLLSTDIRLPALKELKKRARKYGIRGIRTQPHNAIHDEPFRKTFDGVLLDAPCSGWGTWARNPDARWRTSRREVIQSAQRQLKMLNNVVWCVKPGGVLVYAVCTFTRPETEEVVMKFLEQNPNFTLEPFAHPLTGEPTSGQLQIWMDEGPCDAMFIARFVRKENA